MRKILTIVIISAMIAVCGCGANKDSADNVPAAQSSEAAQAGAEAAQSSEAAQAGAEAAQAGAEVARAHIPHRYASRSEGQELLMSNESYYAGFSQNELEFKMQKKGASIEEYKAFAVEQVVDFTQEEIDALDALLGEMGETLTANGYTLPPLDESDIYYTPEQAENFDEIFGTNTDYVVDPEECMADNFGYTLAYGMDGPNGDGYPSPEIIEGIMEYLCRR